MEGKTDPARTAWCGSCGMQPIRSISGSSLLRNAVLNARSVLGYLQCGHRFSIVASERNYYKMSRRS